MPGERTKTWQLSLQPLRAEIVPPARAAQQGRDARRRHRARRISREAGHCLCSISMSLLQT